MAQMGPVLLSASDRRRLEGDRVGSQAGTQIHRMWAGCACFARHRPVQRWRRRLMSVARWFGAGSSASPRRVWMGCCATRRASRQAADHADLTANGIRVGRDRFRLQPAAVLSGWPHEAAILGRRCACQPRQHAGPNGRMAPPGPNRRTNEAVLMCLRNGRRTAWPISRQRCLRVMLH